MKYLPKYIYTIFFSLLVFFLILFIANSNISAQRPCDNPNTSNIEECGGCEDSDDCADGCSQSYACIGGQCSCTEEGTGGDWIFPYCGDCINNYQRCDYAPGMYHETRYCGGTNEICGEYVENYKTCHTLPAGTPETRWCGTTGIQGRCIPNGITAAPLSCDGGPGSFNQTDGFVYKQYARVHIDEEYET